MLKKLLQASAVITSAIALVGCDIDDNMNAPVYSTGSQVRSNNQILGSRAVYSTGSQVAPAVPAPVSSSAAQSSSVSNAYTANNAVKSASQPAVAVTTHRVINATNAPVPVVSSSAGQAEPIVRSTPSTD